MRCVGPAVLVVATLLLGIASAGADIILDDIPRPAPGPHEVAVLVEPHLGPYAASAFGEPYRVQAGDTLMKIARDRLGDAGRWKEIAELNPSIEPERMQVQASLQMPPNEPPPEDRYDFFVVSSEDDWYPLRPGTTLHNKHATTWQIAAVPHEHLSEVLAATRPGEGRVERIADLHGAGRLLLSTAYGGRTVLPAHDPAPKVVLEVKVTAIASGQVVTEAARRGPLPVAPDVAADVIVDDHRAPPLPAEPVESDASTEPEIGTTMIAVLTGLLLAIVVAAFFALRHIERRRET